MINSFSLENFRVFKDKTTIKLKPITILTGPNNSGKSSVNKALLLQKNSFLHRSTDELTQKIPLELIFEGLGKGMANMAQVVSHNSNKKSIKFSIEVFLFGLIDSFSVELSYDLRATGKNYKNDNESSFSGENQNNFTSLNISTSNTLSSFVIKYQKRTIISINFGESNLNSLSPHLNFLLKKEVRFDFNILYLLFKKLIAPFMTVDESNSKMDNVVDLLDHKNIFDFIKYLGHKGLNTKVSLDHLNLLNSNEIIEEINHQLKSNNSSQQIENYFLSFNELAYFFTKESDEIKSKINDLIEIVKLGKYSFEESELLNHLSSKSFQHLFFNASKESPGNLYEIRNTVDEKDLPVHIAILSKEVMEKGSIGIISFLSFIDILFESVLNKIHNSLELTIHIPGIKTQDDYSRPDHYTYSTMKDVYNSQEYFGLFSKINDVKNSPKNELPDSKKHIAPNTKAYHLTRKWLQKFQIADAIEVKMDDYDNSFKMWLINSGMRSKITEVGLGIAQLTFLIASISFSDILSPLKKHYIIEEPESNLHPKFQSMLADYFVDATNNLNKSFLIETHSEYFIRKLQFLIAKGECKPEDVVIYYIDDPDPSKREEGAPQVREITIDKHGRMSQDFGKGFFDEADNLAIQLFQLNQQNFN